MPDGHSDSAIDFYASSFSREVLDTAHPLRFCKERITYSNDIFDGFRGDIWPANTIDEIAHGGRLFGGSRIPLAKLNDGSRPYGRMLDNMLRPFGRRQCKDHYLATYPDDKPVGFTIFDFDRHPPRGTSGAPSTEDDEWLAIDDDFWERVSTFHGLAERLDIDVMWVQSPGRWLIDGHHLPCRMFGLYAIIRHRPHTPPVLRRTLAAFKERIGLDVETSWDTKNRNIRIPGQCFMDVCRVDPSRRSIVPISDAGVSGERERNVARLVATVDGYGKLRRDGGERLLRGEGMLGIRRLRGRPPSVHRRKGPPEGAEGLVTSTSGDGDSASGRSIGDGQGIPAVLPLGKELVTSPRRKTTIRRKRGSTSAQYPHADADNIDPAHWRREPDTFKVLHESGLLRRALREHGWDASRVDEAVAWAAPRLRNLRPASSATCSDGESLARFLRKHYLWGCKTYDPLKAISSARARARIADEARIAPSLRLDDKVLNIYLKGVAGLSVGEMKCIRRFRSLERAHAGRVACRTLYSAFGSQRRFMAFIARHSILHISQEHSQSVGRCRQWAMAPQVIRSVRMLMASPALLLMLRGGEGARDRERVIYSETHQRDTHRRRRISAIHSARESRRTPESVTATVAARGPPLEAPKTVENAMFGIADSATGARQLVKRTLAA